MVILVSDLLVWLLALTGVGGIYLVRQRPHLQAPWRQVLSRPTAMSALCIIFCFVTIGLLDSIHLKASPGEKTSSLEALSLLDLALTPLRSRDERTYSKPLAIYSFSKETVERGDQSQRLYPRLVTAGTHLSHDNRHLPDLLTRGSLGALGGLLISLPLYWLARKKSAAATPEEQLTQPAWTALAVTVGSLITLTCLIATLATEYHPLGTDKVGQDVLYQSLKSVRTGLMIGSLTTLVTLPFALILGVTAGFVGGRTDDLIQYIYTTISSIPGVLLIAATVLTLQVYLERAGGEGMGLAQRADLRLLFLCLVLGITGWIGLCRMLRGESLKLRELEYVQVATAFGVSRMAIIRRHILPNLLHIVLISVVLDFSMLVLAEAVLSYVGVGVDPSMYSWGNMINGARLELAREPVVWWSLLAAFLFMFSLVLSVNLFADAVRDAFDPRLRGT
ncbi:MAG: ABC transporter permease [Gammaproteobacteria bacterium]|nr:ABC transporter permease [Gammaproteobacteria bacterium]